MKHSPNFVLTLARPLPDEGECPGQGPGAQRP